MVAREVVGVEKQEGCVALATDAALALAVDPVRRGKRAGINPKGGAQDVRRFPTEPWMVSRKIPSPMKQLVCFVGEAFFFGSFLLTLIKRNELAHQSESP